VTPGARAACKQAQHGAPPGGSPDPHFRGALPPPDSAFAGAGLNIRRARAVSRGRIPSLTVSERSPCDRRFAADHPLLTSSTLLPSAGSLPPLLHRALSRAAAVVSALGLSRTVWDSCGTAPLGARRLNLSKFLFIQSRLGTLLIGLHKASTNDLSEGHASTCVRE